MVNALSRYLARLVPAEVRELLPPDAVLLGRVFPVLSAIEAVAAPRGPRSRPPTRGSSGGGRSRRCEVPALGSPPLVVAIDDLQWGDVDGAGLIDLLRPPDPPVLLLLGSFRTEDMETSPFLRASRPEEARARERHELAVEALSHAEYLAGELLGPRTASRAGRGAPDCARSGGNPLFIGELVKHTQAGTVRRSVPGSAPSTSTRCSGAVQRLSEKARRSWRSWRSRAGPINQHLAIRDLPAGRGRIARRSPAAGGPADPLDRAAQRE